MLVGRAFGNGDGHVRMTRAERYLLAGGDKEQHERMQEIAKKFDELTKDKETMTQEEALDAARKSGMIEC